MPSRADVAGRVGFTVAALPFFVVGAKFILAPERSGAYVHLEVISAVARTDIRAVYGGGKTGAGVVPVLCAVRGRTFPRLFVALLLAGETAGVSAAFARSQYNRG